jgi:uncharacterized alkaline shock family protein YloU
MSEDQKDKDKYEIPEIEGADHDDATRISDDVIVTIVAKILSGIEGVAFIPGGIVSGILGRKGAGKGIKVETSDQDIVIDVAVILDYGIRIPELSANIQTRIREAVEEMTGKYVRAVNVTVQGMHLPDTIPPHEENQEDPAQKGEGESPSEEREKKEKD